MQFLRKHRFILGLTAVFAVCLAIFAVFWLLNVRFARQKSRSVYLNDTQQAVTKEVDTTISQTFTSDAALYALGVIPSYEGEVLPGTLYLSVYDGAGTLLATVEGNAAETVSGAYAVFAFPHALQSADGWYRLEFWADMQNEWDEIALVKSADSLAGWELVENGRGRDGSLCILATVDVIGTFVDKLYLAFALAASLGICLLFCLACKKAPLHRLFACAAVLLGLLCCFVLPPYSAPQEEGYINQSFQLSSGMLGTSVQDAPPGAVVRRVIDQDVAIQQNGPTIFTYREITRGLFARAGDNTPTAFVEETARAPLAGQLPSALGVTLARLLGLGFVPTLFMGRLLNLALFVALATLAVRAVPFGKALFAGAGLLAISISLAASFAGTGLAIGATMLFCALCLRAAAAPQGAVQKGQAVGLGLSGLYMVLVAPLCAPFLLLLFAIPRDTALGKTASSPWNRAFCPALAAALALVAAGGLFLQWQSGGLAFSLQTTGLTLEDFFKTLLGGLLAGGTISLNWGLAVLALVWLAWAILPEPGEAPLPHRTLRFALPATLAAALLLLLAGGGPAALLPALPMGLLLLQRNWLGIAKTKARASATVFLLAATAVFCLLDAFLIVLTR